MINDDTLKSIWQSQTVDTNSYSFTQLQNDTHGFRRLIQRRNLQESFAAVMVILIFGFYAWDLSNMLMRIGSALVAFNGLLILYQLQHRASLQELPTESLALPYVAYFRQELVRQRDILRKVWLWCIPTLLGMGVFFWGMAQSNTADFPWWICSVIFIPFFMVFAMNYHTSRKLQAKIEQLDQLHEFEKIF